MLEEEYNNVYDSWRQIQGDVHYGLGVRIGRCEVFVELFRDIKKSVNEKNDGKYLNGLYDELQKFHEKYSNLPLQKMVNRLLEESEYLIGRFE